MQFHTHLSADEKLRVGYNSLFGSVTQSQRVKKLPSLLGFLSVGLPSAFSPSRAEW